MFTLFPENRQVLLMKEVLFSLQKTFFLFGITLVIISGSVLAQNGNNPNEDRIYRIGLPNVPGLMSRDSKGKIHGLPLEVFEAIAKDENIRFEWVDGSWNELFQSIQKGEIDVLPGTQETDERKKIIDFTKNKLYAMWSELYIHKKVHFENILQLQYQRIGLVKEDNNAKGFQNYLKDFDIAYIPVYFKNHAEGLLSLSKQEIYGMAGPAPNILGEMPPNIVCSGLYFNPVDLKYSFPKNKNLELQKKIDHRLAIYQQDKNSIYHQLYEKYRLDQLKKSTWKMPVWSYFLISIIACTLIITSLFIVILKRQVNRRTKELKNREVFLRKAIEVGEMGIWQLNLETKRTYWSNEIYQFTGIKKEKEYLTFNDIRKFLHQEDIESMISFFKNIETKETFEKNYRIINSSNQTIHLKLVGQILKNENNENETAVGIIQNVSKQKLYEEELIISKEKAERNEKLKSAFLANMSHEIRTPLNSIIGFSHLIATEEIDDLKKIDYHKIILKQNEVLLTLINDIIDISKIESGSIEIKMANTNIRSLLKNIYNSHQQYCPELIDFQLNIQLTIEKCTVYTDRTRLEQILNNLISNAFKYTPEGKVIIGCRNSKNPKYFEIYVEDTGIGISKKDQSLLFHRFNQLDSLKQGAGLGLAISQSLAIILGSRIEIISDEGQGSEFYLALPFANLNQNRNQ